jgi:RTX calcium-binding nonapeptide repeat (4 copies)
MSRSTPFALALVVLALGTPSAGLGAVQPPCTITAPAHERVVLGTPRADVICATKGAHVVRGLGGSDTIITGSGADTVNGGTGDDIIEAGGGGDVIAGGSGNDTLEGQSGGDQIAGDAGDDELLGGVGDDDLAGGTGDDNLDPGPGHNRCTPGTGSDRLGLWCDSTPPVLESLTLSTDQIDTSQGPATIHVTAHITDDLSGLRQAVMRFGEVTQGNAVFSADFRTSGTAQDGIYEFTTTVPRYTRQGTFHLAVYLVDAQNNYQLLSSDALAAAGLPSAVEQVGPGDVAAPELRSISLDAPASVDTSTGTRTVYANLHITDDLAGLMYGWVWLTNPLTSHRVGGYVEIAERVSGTPTDGVYRVAIPMEPDTARGTWTVTSVELRDTTYHDAALDAAAVADRATGGLSVEQTGDPDAIPPVLTSVSFSPDVVDESSDFVIHMTVEASDAETGISQVDCDFSPPSGAGGVRLSFATMPGYPSNIVSGDKYDGTFTTGTMYDAGSLEPGVWSGGCFAVDWAGNRGPTFIPPPITIE